MIGIRIFIAIQIPGDIKDYLSDVQEILRENSNKGRFTPKENIHLALRFIGEVGDDELHKLKRAMDEVAADKRNFEIYLNDLGRFPRGDRSIMWMGIQQNQMLQGLYSDLELALEKEGYNKENRRFTPHITLGRQVALTRDFEDIKNNIHMDRTVITIDRITLMESKRVEGVLKYIPEDIA